jgi:hypothetical protein
VPHKILAKTLAARKAGKCVKIHLKHCEENICKLPTKTLKKIIIHKKAVHILKKMKAKKHSDTVKAANCMTSKQLQKEHDKCMNPKKCKSNVGKLPSKLLIKLIKTKKKKEKKVRKIKRQKRRVARIIRRKKRVIRRKMRKIKRA